MTRNITYQIIRSNRKTIAIQITPTGEVVVRCPQRMPTAQIQAFLEEKQDWLRKHLEKIESRPALPRFTEAQIRDLADKMADHCGGWAAVLGGSDGAYSICIVSRGGDVKSIGEKLGARGGGKPGFFQGSIRASRDQIEAILSQL